MNAVDRPEPWRRRAIRFVLYGRNPDRSAKARARLGLTIAVFAGVYTILAMRLVVFAVTPENHATRRAPQDAMATARPDIVDRNGEVLATDVKAPSLFAEPRKILDVDEAVELLSAVLPDLDAKEVRERLDSAAASPGSNARSRRNSSRRFTGSAFRASASCRRTGASIRTVRKSRT